MKIITVFIFVLVCVVSGFGQVNLSEALEEVIQCSDPVYYVDETGKLPFSEVREMRFGDSLSAANHALGKMNRNRTVWARFDLVLKDTLREEIALRTARFARVRVYLVGKDRLDSVDVGMADLGFLADEDTDLLAVDLALEPGNEIRVFLRVVNYSHIFFSNSFWFDIFPRSTLDGYVKSRKLAHRATTYFYVFFCGLLLFQLFYVTFQWYLMRRREYLYYGLYMLTVFIYFYNRFSVLYAHLPALAIIDAETMLVLNDTLLVLPSLFYFRFARYFVDLRTNDIRLDVQFRRFEWFLLGSVVLLIGFQIFPTDFPKRIIITAVLAAQFVFSIYALFRIYRIKTTVAYFLMVGSSCALLSHVLANVAPIALPWLLEYVAPLTITMYGILMEIAIFNAGLLFKAKAEEREKVRVHRAYIYELKSRQELQSAYTEVRDKIASDLHDDIGSSLSSINIYSYAASQKLEQGDVEQAGGLLKNIERSAFETLASMSDLVWAINPNNDSPVKLIERVQSFAFEILSAAEARFEMDVDPDFCDTFLSQSERKNILLILKEAVNNAAKYAEASVVLLKIARTEDDAFVFSLSDNGKGIPSGQEQGNGMRTMRARAAELGGFFEVKTAPGETSILFGLRTEKADR